MTSSLEEEKFFEQLQPGLQSIVFEAEHEEEQRKFLEEDYLRASSEKLDELERIKKNLENRDLEQSIKFRRELTSKIFRVIKIWLGFIGFIVLLNGAKGCGIPLTKTVFNWHLSDNVMIALLGTTTITIIGLFATVTNHFFNKGK
ncbi:MAG: hypothetical protein SFU25_08680 [Candidatus Caenarcaniphilales bacterium]|nr:hypothetical protein [Candidatus Caenarcaniphilales bacterium]